MSISHSNSDLPGAVEPTLYLLEMDSTFNLRTSDAQVIPLHVLNNGTDLGPNRFFLPIQNKEESQQQVQVLIDPCPAPAVKFVTIQVESSCQQEQQMSVCQTDQLSSPLTIVSSNQLPCLGDEVETSGMNLIRPLTNSSEQSLNVACKGMQNYVHISDRSIPPRAIAVLPTILHIRQKDKISPRRSLLPRTRFGPIQGVKQRMSLEKANEVLQEAVINKRPLFMLKDDDEHIEYINVTDKDKANWIGLLPLGDDISANVWIYEENNELYIITTEAVPSRKQLMLGYSQKYAQEYGLVGPTKNIETGFPLSSKMWWCYECQRAMTSASQLQRHMNTHHQEYKANTKRRRYRCRHCARTFSRIFTLRRHVARHCEKKPKKSDSVINTETLQESILNTSLNSEDNRVPSDESFQNYSNGLDFSTNLFDTDRIPSLDISGNSRSEVFNPYGLDNISSLTNDLEYTNGSLNKVDVSPAKENEKNQQEKDTETSVSCTYCKQLVARGKKRQHISECPARRFECDCKQIFTSKELLALHIYSEHSTNKETEEEEQNEDNDTTSVTVQNNKAYVCEQCQHAFKRRGMLVNHLWRVHNTAPTRVPLVRRERHFPCGACPKLYRTAAKRRRHLRLHHPGSENIRAKEIEGGTRTCSPAACTECPRQYATRAKLLQHQRQHHPYLVQPATLKKTNLTEKDTKTNERVTTSEELHKYKTNLQQLLNFY
ncbi:unnamed protein product [Arctia plantaginis]|uniref:C2H2-type domain-containing protein n=1 Tax=Arctia plantaginis TaxID=874455 RepID=A0A8S1APW2_ARCPL|nr:unnamed protein product [Arctia plantaginis]